MIPIENRLPWVYKADKFGVSFNLYVPPPKPIYIHTINTEPEIGVSDHSEEISE